MDKKADYSFDFRTWWDNLVNVQWWFKKGKAIQLKNDFKTTFSTPEGKRVLQYLTHFCRLDHSCWSFNEREHCFSEGRRDVILEIVNWIDVPVETIRKYNKEVIARNMKDEEISMSIRKEEHV